MKRILGSLADVAVRTGLALRAEKPTIAFGQRAGFPIQLKADKRGPISSIVLVVRITSEHIPDLIDKLSQDASLRGLKVSANEMAVENDVLAYAF